MPNQTFRDYLRSVYTSPTSSTVYSYLKSIQIMDEIFALNDIFDLNNQSLSDIKDLHTISLIKEFIIDEEDKYRKGIPSFFDSCKANQTSYPAGRFCRAAMNKLEEYVGLILRREVAHLRDESGKDGKKLSEKLSQRLKINDKGTEKEVRAKRRVGQNIFRDILLEIYDTKCCLTGLEIPEVLRASHIIPWSDCDDQTRLDPANGICLSATYDVAFDRHLISFDEDYRMILSPLAKEEYNSKAFKTYFLDFEGKKITMPSIYIPSQEFLSKHREKLIS